MEPAHTRPLGTPHWFLSGSCFKIHRVKSHSREENRKERKGFWSRVRAQGTGEAAEVGRPHSGVWLLLSLSARDPLELSSRAPFASGLGLLSVISNISTPRRAKTPGCLRAPLGGFLPTHDQTRTCGWRRGSGRSGNSKPRGKEGGGPGRSGPGLRSVLSWELALILMIGLETRIIAVPPTLSFTLRGSSPQRR